MDFAYSLCNTDSKNREKCFQLYTKVKRKPKRRTRAAGVGDGSENGLLSFLQKYEDLVDGNGTKEGFLAKHENKSPKQRLARNDSPCCSNQSAKTDGDISRLFGQLEVYGDLLTITEKVIDLKLESPEHENITKTNADTNGKHSRESRETAGQSNRTSETNLGDSNTLCPVDTSSETRVKNNRAEVTNNGRRPSLQSRPENRACFFTSQEKQLCPIEVDDVLTNELQLLPAPNWTCENDTELVQLLVKSLGGVSNSKFSSKVGVKHD